MAGRKKELKFINYILINGERIPMDSLSDDEKLKINIALNDQAMKNLGYAKIDKTA